MFQHGSSWADGPVGVTQCPIAPGNSFLYQFSVPDQAGTFWYHSHHCTLTVNQCSAPNSSSHSRFSHAILRRPERRFGCLRSFGPIQAFVRILLKISCFSHPLTFAFRYDFDDGNGAVDFARYSLIILNQKQLSLHSRTGKDFPCRVAISEIRIEGTTRPLHPPASSLQQTRH